MNARDIIKLAAQLYVYVHRNALRKLPDRNIRQENNCH